MRRIEGWVACTVFAGAQFACSRSASLSGAKNALDGDDGAVAVGQGAAGPAGGATVVTHPQTPDGGVPPDGGVAPDGGIPPEGGVMCGPPVTTLGPKALFFHNQSDSAWGQFATQLSAGAVGTFTVRAVTTRPSILPGSGARTLNVVTGTWSSQSVSVDGDVDFDGYNLNQAAFASGTVFQIRERENLFPSNDGEASADAIWTIRDTSGGLVAATVQVTASVPGETAFFPNPILQEISAVPGIRGCLVEAQFPDAVAVPLRVTAGNATLDVPVHDSRIVGAFDVYADESMRAPGSRPWSLSALVVAERLIANGL